LATASSASTRAALAASSIRFTRSSTSAVNVSLDPRV
jgi:hypothetical protein